MPTALVEVQLSHYFKPLAISSLSLTLVRLWVIILAIAHRGGLPPICHGSQEPACSRSGLLDGRRVFVFVWVFARCGGGDVSKWASGGAAYQGSVRISVCEAIGMLAEV